MSRSKSPVGGGLRNGVAPSFARSKSPPRTRALGTSNAFKSYTGTSSPFAVPSPPVKKQRQDQSSETESWEADKQAGSSKLNNKQETESAEGSEEENKQPTFADRLRAQKQSEGMGGGDDANTRMNLPEQEVTTGEEDEETLFQVRGKLFYLSNQNQWKEKGTGLLKLNVRRTDGAGARIVMRKEAVYTLLLNVTLFKGMRCSIAQDPRYVRFSTIEEGQMVHYNLRLANAKVATDLLAEVIANLPNDGPEQTPV